MMPLTNYANTESLDSFLYRVSSCVEKRFSHLTEDEKHRVEQELKYAFEVVDQAKNINDLMVLTAQPFTPIYSNVEDCLERIHHVAGYGTLASCLSSRHIVEALFDFGLCSQFGAVDPNLIIGRGHIAPLIYAHRYLRQGISLVFLMVLHEELPAVVNKPFGFSYTMRHSLGEGIGMAVGRAYTHPEQRVVCFSGDGELNEGTSYEGIRQVFELGIKNLTLIIDANGQGIDPLPKPLNEDYLSAYFAKTWEVNGHDLAGLRKALDCAATCGESVAIICHTEKKGHSYKRQSGGTKAAPSCCSQVAAITQQVSSLADTHVFTADLAARFGLKAEHNFLNLGLAESSLLSVAMGYGDQDLKFVLTDDKYYLNAVDVMHSALINSQNLHIVAARKNGVWGGPTYVPSLFGLLTEQRIFELTDPNDLKDIIVDKQEHNENGVYLMYDQSMDNIQALRKEYHRINPYSYVRTHQEAQCLIITSESMAHLIYTMADELNASHLRFLEVRPQLSAKTQTFIQSFDKVIVAEHNTSRGGLADYIEASLLIRVHRIFSESYEWPSLKTFQKDVAPNLIRQIGIESAESIQKFSQSY